MERSQPDPSSLERTQLVLCCLFFPKPKPISIRYHPKWMLPFPTVTIPTLRWIYQAETPAWQIGIPGWRKDSETCDWKAAEYLRHFLHPGRPGMKATRTDHRTTRKRTSSLMSVILQNGSMKISNSTRSVKCWKCNTRALGVELLKFIFKPLEHGWWQKKGGEVEQGVEWAWPCSPPTTPPHWKTSRKSWWQENCQYLGPKLILIYQRMCSFFFMYFFLYLHNQALNSILRGAGQEGGEPCLISARTPWCAFKY